MKNEAGLRHTEKFPRASLHVPLAERFMATKLPLLVCKANASFLKMAMDFIKNARVQISVSKTRKYLYYSHYTENDRFRQESVVFN